MSEPLRPHDLPRNDRMADLADTALGACGRALGITPAPRTVEEDVECLAMIEEMRPSPGAFAPGEIHYTMGLTGPDDIKKTYARYRWIEALPEDDPRKSPFYGLSAMLRGEPAESPYPEELR